MIKMKKYLSLIIALSFLSYTPPAYATFEFVQKIQKIALQVQQKAKEVQEKIATVKAEVMSKVQAAQNMKSKAEEGMKNLKEGKVDTEALKKMNKTIKGTEKANVKDDKEGSAKVMEENFVVKEGEGDSVEAQKQMDAFMQEALRDSVSKLYAVAYATRANFAKEKPRDVDMEATDQILMETNVKASQCVERIATIYTLKSMVQSYNYIEAMQSLKVDTTQQEEKE